MKFLILILIIPWFFFFFFIQRLASFKKNNLLLKKKVDEQAELLRKPNRFRNELVQVREELKRCKAALADAELELRSLRGNQKQIADKL